MEKLVQLWEFAYSSVRLMIFELYVSTLVSTHLTQKDNDPSYQNS